MPFRRPDRSTWYVQIATPRGVVRRSTGSPDREVALAIEGALRSLRAAACDDLLEAVADGRLELGALLAAEGDPVRLRAAAEVDLSSLVEEFGRALAGRVAPATARRYARIVSSLVAPTRAFPRAELTTQRLERWLAAYPGHDATRRAAHVAMSRFGAFLVERRLLPENPMRAVAPPPAGEARCQWVDSATMLRLAEAQPAPFCALSALLGGTGLGVTAVLALRRADVDLDRREVRAPGARARARARTARVAEWAWRHVARHCRPLPHDAPLFAGIGRHAVEAAHREACRREGIDDYRLGDQRHSWAVRAVRAGTPLDLVAHQLGHATPTRALALYGRFVPDRVERDRWEQLATALDAERAAAEKVALGHALYHPVYQPRPSDRAREPNARSDNDLGDLFPRRRSFRPGTGGSDDTAPRTLGG